MVVLWSFSVAPSFYGEESASISAFFLTTLRPGCSAFAYGSGPVLNAKGIAGNDGEPTVSTTLIPLARNVPSQFGRSHQDLVERSTSLDDDTSLIGKVMDTVNVPFARNGRPGEVKLILPFLEDRIAGRFVYHCHILEHEDGGMMANINVLPQR